MLRVADVEYIKRYELALKFNTGKKKFVDLQPHLAGEVFGELLNKTNVIQYALNLSWFTKVKVFIHCK